MEFATFTSMRIHLFLISILLLFVFHTTLFAQSEEDTAFVLKRTVYQGDTIPMFELQPIPIFSPREFKNKREKRKYDRLHRYVVKVYPYAEVAGEMLRNYDDTLKLIKTETQRKKYMKKVEEGLKEEFSGELRRLTIMQGIILIKLIDRETGTTSYDLIKQLRGSFSAFMWQSLARLFGSNLKLEYDPLGEDEMIEEIVQKIEYGLIPYQKRERKK